VALAEERNFTRAAVREHIAQPALSQQVRRLEDQLGLVLVERTTRQMHLTEAGELLVARARRIMAEVDAAHAELDALKGIDVGRVRVGAMHTMGPVDVSLALAIFHGRHPGVELTVREESSEQAELRDEEFISFRRGARLRELLFAAGRHAGFEPQVKLELNESQRIRRLVARGMGVAILPRSDAVFPGIENAVAALTDPPLSRDITLAWRQERKHPPAVAEFLALARETFTESG
jgi:DNA-binding transcriptional LysR family regulator